MSILPPKCGNWVHIPMRFANASEAYPLLAALDFRQGYVCRRHSGCWRHLHPPKGWKIAKEPGCDVLLDTKGRARVHILPDIPHKGTLAEVRVLTYYRITPVATGMYGGICTAECDILDPFGNVCHRGFATETQVTPGPVDQYTLVEHTWQAFMRRHPQAADPLAYWE